MSNEKVPYAAFGRTKCEQGFIHPEKEEDDKAALEEEQQMLKWFDENELPKSIKVGPTYYADLSTTVKSIKDRVVASRPGTIVHQSYLSLLENIKQVCLSKRTE